MLTVITALISFTPLAVPSAVPQQTGALQSLGVAQRNLLGNGGFEVWSFGDTNAPDLWNAFGDPATQFAATGVTFLRVPESCGGSGWSAELSVDDANNYVAQRLENFSELRERNVTFSVDLDTPFSVALPKIEVWDGVSTSEYSDIIFGNAAPTRFTVTHRLDPCATVLEVRIYADQTVIADGAMLIPGKTVDAAYVPRRNPEPALMQLPLGAVVDWYRFNASMPVPEGFAVADGATVEDPSSPFFGLPTPDLSGRFVRGVTSVGAIGETGGSANADLSHTHDMNHYHDGTTGSASSSWLILQNPIPPWLSAGRDNHTHQFTTSSPKGEPSSNNHTGSALDNVSIEPPYVGLLKIMRIK